jgi:D-3-phosphoglycerate dehydrogenase
MTTPLALKGRRRILIVDPIHEAATAELTRLFDVCTHLQPTENELTRMIGGAHVIVLRSGVQLTAPVIAAAKELKIIARAGVGVDNINLDEARRAGIIVFNVPSASANAVAEFAIGLIIAVTRHIPLADAELRKNRWKKAELAGMELRGRTLGLIGFGSIGSRIAALGCAFGMNVLATVNHPHLHRCVKLQAIQLVDLPRLLEESDVVCLAIPLNDSTRQLIGHDQLALMKPGAYLINLSRGEVVNERDLYRGLCRGQIAGAALDVTAEEGIGTDLARLKNVVLTPHIAAMTTTSQERIGEIVVSSIVAGLNGERVENQVC